MLVKNEKGLTMRVRKLLSRGRGMCARLMSGLGVQEQMSYDGNDPAKMAATLASYDVISFDIFDTLIRRDVDCPTDLFYELERRNGLPRFHDMRISMEASARRDAKDKNGEVNIFDIYSKLTEHYELDIEASVTQELAAEKETCYPDAKMSELYQLLVKRGCRMIAVSDMYIPGKYLRELLDGCGYSAIERVFVSCDYGVGKGHGELQKLVQKEIGDQLRVVHIGDNYHSDVMGSKAADWTAVWAKAGNKKDKDKRLTYIVERKSCE